MNLLEELIDLAVKGECLCICHRMGARSCGSPVCGPNHKTAEGVEHE